MSRFLTSAWVDEVDRLVRSDPSLRRAAAGRRFVLQQAVDRGSEEPVIYHLVFDDGSVSAAWGAADHPDLALRTDLATATAISRGDESAQAAFMAGRLRIDGEVGALLANAELFGAMADVLGPLRDTTEY